MKQMKHYRLDASIVAKCLCAEFRNLLGLKTVIWVVSCVLWAGLVQAGVVVSHPYQGVTHIARSESSPRPLKIHVVQIDMTAPGISFKLTPPGGTRDTVRQTTLGFLNQEHAQVAINCHFFVPYPTTDTDANVVGLAASGGVVYSPFEPQPVAAGFADQSYAIIANAPALNIDGSNHASIVHRDPSNSDSKHVLEPVTLWNTFCGSAQIVSHGVRSIPSYVGAPFGLNPLNGYSDSYSWYALTNARTAIGMTADSKTLVLFTVDKAGGMTVGEVADLLIKDYQVFNALNMDGGGSTTLALQDPVTLIGSVVNVPVDSPPRAVGSNLAIFAQPMPVLLTIALIAGNTTLISWPAPSTGWQLQHSPDLNATNWSTIDVTPQQVGERMQVISEVPATQEFYRLRRF